MVCQIATKSVLVLQLVCKWRWLERSEGVGSGVSLTRRLL